jgi:hypothetical protein
VVRLTMNRGKSTLYPYLAGAASTRDLRLCPWRVKTLQTFFPAKKRVDVMANASRVIASLSRACHRASRAATDARTRLGRSRRRRPSRRRVSIARRIARAIDSNRLFKQSYRIASRSRSRGATRCRARERRRARRSRRGR